MKYKEIATAKLVEHPENRKLFRDIKDTDPAFWREFVESIKTFGIIEPLIVNQTTMHVRSGNQRLKAALEIGIETVPILLVDPETETDDEIRKMIASNVFRRTINPFAMFEYIGRLRGNHDGTPRKQEGKSKSSVSTEVHKSDGFVSAADIYNSWTDEQKAAIDEWYEQKTEGKNAGKEGELIAMIRAAEEKYGEAERELEDHRSQLQEIEEELEAVRAEKVEAELEAGRLQEQVDELDKDIDELRNTDEQEERDAADRTINDLLEKQNKLREQIKLLKDTPDINFYLIEAVKKQKEINSMLQPIVDNVDALNPGKLQELETALKRTLEIIKKGTNQNGQKDRRELTE